jgi:hypothetical protein
MQKYKEYAPTGFDASGLGLPDRQEWSVAPVFRTRDADTLMESNFEAALETFGGEGNNVELHRFGHWGSGWFEIIILRPDSPEEARGKKMEVELDDYPVLDDDDFQRREWELLSETAINRAEEVAFNYDGSLCSSFSAEKLCEDLCWHSAYEGQPLEAAILDALVENNWLIKDEQ